MTKRKLTGAELHAAAEAAVGHKLDPAKNRNAWFVFPPGIMGALLECAQREGRDVSAMARILIVRGMMMPAPDPEDPWFDAWHNAEVWADAAEKGREAFEKAEADIEAARKAGADI